MNKLCRQYMSDVKALFPIIGKSEKKFINSLSINIDEYCVEENINSIETLYEKYGTPYDIINNYFSTSDTSEIIKKIKITQFVKRTLIALLIIILLVVTIWGINCYNTYQTFINEQAIFTDTTIDN